MLNPLLRLKQVLLLVAAIIAIGTAGYRVITGLSWLDSFYFTVITMSTVGFREVAELDATGKLFTIALIFSGAGVLAYGVTTTIEIMLHEETRGYLSILLNSRRTRKLENHFIVCGLGRVGMAVAEELSGGNTPFLVVDADTKKAHTGSAKGWMVVHGDATEDRILEQANITKAKGLISCVDTDATNLFVVISAKGLNPNLEISARVNDETNVKKFERAGATHVYSPFSLLGRRMARVMTRPRVLEILDLALEQTNYQMTMEECTISEKSPLAWISLKDSGIRQNFGAVVLSIIRRDRQIVHNPSADLVCEPGDILVALGTPDNLRKMREALEIK